MTRGVKIPIFDISDLLPNLGALGTEGLSGSEGLSAAFILLLIVIFILGLAFAVWQTAAAHERIRSVLRALKGLNTKNLHQKYESVGEQIRRGQARDLWKEFRESLVVAPGRSHVYNTIDAAHFFNESTLAHGITQNRFLSAIPGLLTAIGVIGTFVGLTLGLSLINGLGGEKSLDDIKTGISGLLQGASIAFLTSVWGVTTSVLFNIIEKVLERSVRTNIRALQHRIDILFPRFTPEGALLEISDHGKESSETLKGLAEQIGARLQQAVGDMNERMREALEDTLRNVLQPAVEALVRNQEQITTRQAEGSQKALQELVERFMDGMTAEGRHQQQALEQAAGAFRETAEKFTSRLTTFVDGVESHRREQERAQKEQAETFRHQLDQLKQAQEEQGKRLDEAFDGLLQKLGAGMDRLNAQAIEADRTRRASLDEYTKKLSEAGEKTIERLSGMLEEQQTAIRQLINQSADLIRQVREAGQGLQGSSDSLVAATENLNEVANRLLELGHGLANASRTVSHQMAQAAQRVEAAARTNIEIHEKSESLIEQAQRIQHGLEQAAATLMQAAATAERGFTGLKEHHGAFLESLRDEVETLARRIAELLKEYASEVNGQVEERMREWNRQTSQYTSTMTSAIQSISNVVDEIEAKVTA